MEQDQIVTDLELVEHAKGGRIEAFSELVKRHQKGLLRLVFRMMKDTAKSEDIVQEAFIKAYEKLESFEGRSSFRSWLIQIALNTAKNKLRVVYRDFSDISQIHLAVAPKAESQLLGAAVSDLLQKEIDRLPAKQKTALVLRVYDDLSFKEIAELMDCPYDTAKANYRHAILKLKEALKGQDELKQWLNGVGDFFQEMGPNLLEVEGWN